MISIPLSTLVSLLMKKKKEIYSRSPDHLRNIQGNNSLVCFFIFSTAIEVWKEVMF